jgi:hypothetical protein
MHNGSYIDRGVGVYIYAEGETFLAPAIGISIHWLSKYERREKSKNIIVWKSDEGAWEDIRQDSDWEVVLYWKTMFSSRDETKESYSDEEYCKNAIKEMDDEKVAFKHSFVWSVKDYCVENYDAKSPEEVVWDYVGVPCLVTDDKDADKLLEKAGWENQGYKAGNDLSLATDPLSLEADLFILKATFGKSQI